jgi:hypothetical protein
MVRFLILVSRRLTVPFLVSKPHRLVSVRNWSSGSDEQSAVGSCVRTRPFVSAALSPIVIRMEFRLAELENPARQHGVRLGQVATRQNAVNELKRASIVMRAESYRRRLFSEFDRAKEVFLR